MAVMNIFALLEIKHYLQVYVAKKQQVNIKNLATEADQLVAGSIPPLCPSQSLYSWATHFICLFCWWWSDLIEL